MRNWKFLIKLLADRPHTVGAEIGVFEGDCSVKLLEGLPHLERLICIDPWDDDDDFHQLMPNKQGRILTTPMAEAKATFLARVAPFADRVMVVQMTSVEAAELIFDGTLDFVHIDGNHAYEYVKDDIRVWSKKVHEAGTITGHDYVNKPNYGVIDAVKEAFGSDFNVDRKSKVWYVTREERSQR